MMRNYFVIFLCLLMIESKGQQVRDLRVGDTLPQIQVSYLSGDSVKTLPLHTLYKDNCIIIDFWATWCSACLKAMAVADSVSKEFSGKLTILPVTYEDQQSVRKFVKKNKILSKLDLNYVVNDSLLMGGYFKFITLPHEVWINTKGIVQAITYPDEITFDNVSLFVNNQPFNAAGKKDDMTFDMKAPLRVDNDQFLYRSVLTSYKPGLENLLASFTRSYVKGEQVDRFLAINKNILSLFYAAYSQNEGDINYDRVEMHIKDSFAFSPFLKGDNVSRQVIMQNSFCYELQLPEKVSKKAFYSFLLEDLNRLFPFYASVEKRMKMCWILVNKEKDKNPTTFGSRPELIWDQGFIKKLNNQTMKVLIAYLNWNMDLPVIDESHFLMPFDMNLDLAARFNGKNVFFDVNMVTKSLRQYGFDLIKGKRVSDVLVIRQKENK